MPPVSSHKVLNCPLTKHKTTRNELKHVVRIHVSSNCSIGGKHIKQQSCTELGLCSPPHVLSSLTTCWHASTSRKHNSSYRWTVGSHTDCGGDSEGRVPCLPGFLRVSQGPARCLHLEELVLRAQLQLFVRIHVGPPSSLRRSLPKIRTLTICSSIHSGVSFVW